MNTHPHSGLRPGLRHTLASLLLALAGASLTLPALAGRPCEDAPLSVEAIDKGLRLAENLQRRLDATGAQVVVLARAGQDLSAYGLRWSHLGLAYREGDGERAHWRVVHKLNHCGTAQAALYRQGLGPFFLDRPFRYEAAFVELSAQAQAQLLPLLRDNAAVQRLHEPRYNMVAYPWATLYQQSNQWAIETLAAAMEPQAATRRQAQAWLQLRGYEPSVLRIGAFTRLGAQVTRANVAFDDHPNRERFADRIATVSVDSVFEWLQRSGLGEGAVVRVSL
ncbi:MAG: DUF2145 domain-containing protein [Rubrivivax sp.]|nr:DUF2145 domain-containing protein [Rubrivivax sp.]